MRLALGTVQFGLAYGVAGRHTPVPEDEVRAILSHAADSGVETLDTAAAYGDIEQRLGRLIGDLPFKVISKVPAIPPSLVATEAARFAFESAERSLQRLNGLLRGLMMHQSSDLSGDRGLAIMDRLRPWADANDVTLGISAYGADDVSRCRANYSIALAQLPGNALDQRIASPDVIAQLRGMEIHLRSAFLQGLLLMPLGSASSKVPSAIPALQQWHTHCARTGQTPLRAALSVVKSFELVSAVVVGVDSLQQWHDITAAWQSASAQAAPRLACPPDAPFIDPRQWSAIT